MKKRTKKVYRYTAIFEPEREGGYSASIPSLPGCFSKGETFEETLKREIEEESNMEVLSWKPVGYQKVIDTRDGSYVYQLRVVADVRPYGEFTKDPALRIVELKLINPKDYKQYFDWKKIGDRIMERALELQEKI